MDNSDFLRIVTDNGNVLFIRGSEVRSIQVQLGKNNEEPSKLNTVTIHFVDGTNTVPILTPYQLGGFEVKS